MSSPQGYLYREAGEGIARNGPAVVHGGYGSDRASDHPPLLAGIQPEDRARLLAAARSKELARGQMLYLEGDSLQQVWLLTAGFVKTTQIGTGGVEVILRLSGPNDVLGAFDLATGVHSSAAQALRSCRALVWEAYLFRRMLERYPVLHQNMARMLGGHLLELQERFREVATERVAPRVARQVIRLLDTIGRTRRAGVNDRMLDGEVDIGLSREELAQMTGTTLFTISRLLSAWQARGIVKPRREAFTICDLPSLRALCNEQ